MSTPTGEFVVSKRASRVGVFFGLAVSAVFVVVFLRVAKLQVAPGPALAAHTSARESSVRLAPMRGVLRDRRGRALAAPKTTYRVIVDPALVDEDALGALFVGLGREMGISPEAVGERVLRAMDRNDARVADSAAHSASEAEANQDDWRETLRSMVTMPEATPKGPKLVRYVRVGEPVGADVADRVRALKLAGVSLEAVESRAYPAGDLVASVVGRVGAEPLGVAADGWLGAEKRWDARLSGETGRGTYVRDHLGRPLWVERGAWSAPDASPDLHLSLDLEIQRIAMDELRRGVEEADAAAGRIVVMAPETGEVLAMGDVYRDVPDAVEVPWFVRGETDDAWRAPDSWQAIREMRRVRFKVIPPDPRREQFAALGRNRCVEDVYEPGSTFKPLVWSEAMRLGLLPSDEIVATHDNKYRIAGRLLSDVTPRDALTWDEVLVYSSNIGMAQAAQRMTFRQLRDTVVRYGFDRPSGLGLSGDSAGIITSARDWNLYSQVSVAMGHEVAVTPVQMARAFCVFARNDERAGTLPTVRLTASDELAGAAYDPMPVLVERVLPRTIALQARAAMGGVVERLDGLNERRFGDDPDDPAAWTTYSMFGKSGTAQIPCVAPGKDAEGNRYRRPPGMGGYYDGQYNSSFVAAAPADEPRLVVLVVIDDPGPGLVRVRQQWGSWTAGPVVRRVVERTLRYLDVPPTPRVEQVEGPGLARSGTP